MPGTFHCTVITPDREVLDTDATFVVLPAHDGEIGILKGRAPLVCKLGIGILKVDTPSAQNRLFVDGGFAQVLNDEVTVLTAQALAPEQVDTAAATASLQAATATHPTDPEGQLKREQDLARARAKLKLAGG